ncbi:ketopantoate reductase family protein [Uliginosibacterium gangwonense]|uniref:ketopantoate reductase family protein n=1 Tax=Uliginosibacterium gangwonense TaxID=392736 RepID=UPI00037329F8|nr:ketopantoate reductase family protein [Uliginosibacterium gangwonense]
MRFLIVGAGALGGYFGGRLLAAGQDVSFLLRERRAAQIAQTGLVIKSGLGDAHFPNPPVVLAKDLNSYFDVILIGCKAYDLESTMDSIAPAVGPNTMILPMLNGLCHLDALAQRFGHERVLGGFCFISAALDSSGVIQHLGDYHILCYGEIDGSRTPRIEALESAFAKVNFTAQLSPDILQAMWEKWISIAALAGITCLMRGSIGAIVEAGAGDIALALYEECCAIAAHNGHAPSAAGVERARNLLTTPGSLLTASMFKDMQRGAVTEAEHIIGELIKRGEDAGKCLLLRTAYAHVKIYEGSRQG